MVYHNTIPSFLLPSSAAPCVTGCSEAFHSITAPTPQRLRQSILPLHRPVLRIIVNSNYGEFATFRTAS